MACRACLHMRQEISSSMFDLSEPNISTSSNQEKCGIGCMIKTNSVIDNDGNIPQIDVVQTFSPSASPPRFAVITLKLFMLVWVVSIMVTSIQNSSYPSFWLAYLTHWGWVVTNAYFICSVLSVVLLWRCPSLGYDGSAPSGSDVCITHGNEAGMLVKFTWALFAMALPIEIVITILFWLLEFDGNFRYVSIMVHGGGTILVFLDGFLLSRIPLRMKQFLLFEGFSALYLIWNLIHAYSGIGNPYKGLGIYEDDDAIYCSLRWNANLNGAAILAVGVLFLVNPIVFLICRAVSRMLPLRLNGKMATLELQSTHVVTV